MWEHGDVDAVGELVTDPLIRHTSAGTKRTSLVEYKKLLVQYQRVLHGAVTTIDDEAVSGDRIWVRATSRGVNLETGEPALFTWMVVFRVAESKLAEYWALVAPRVSWHEP